jgi:ribosomal protein S18 acetylase RimI-like enzyme
MNELGLLARIEANMLAVAARGREVADVGAFRVFISRESANYLLSVALPVRAPDRWGPAIAALDAAFEAWGRRPRLEYIAERYPNLGPALAAAEFDHTMTAPIMALGASDLAPAAPVPGTRFVMLGPGDGALLSAFLAMQGRAYGMPMTDADEGWYELMRAGLADGAIMAGALMRDGQVVSGASLLLGAGAAELAGVGTRPEGQRQGLASDACGRLLAAYFQAGHDLCWLSAAEGAEGVYRRLGFRTVGEQRNYGRPPR